MAGRRDAERHRAGRTTLNAVAPIAVAVVAIALRIAGAIVLETLALVVWNVGTRSPVDFVRDVARSLRRVRAIFVGFVCLLVGFIFIAAATVLLLPAMPDPLKDLVPVQIFTLLVALFLEHLVGPDLRRLATGHADKQTPS